MVPSKKTNQLRRAWPWWRGVLTGLSALGLALSAYLGWHHLVGGTVIGCGGGSPCELVLSSRWSAVGGIAGGVPVSGLAAGTYLAMLVASLFIGPATAAADRRLAWGAILVLVGAAAGSAVWFTIVQRWIIGAFCPYCMATHITGLLLAALVLWQAPRQFAGDLTDVALTNRALTDSTRDVRAAPPATSIATTGDVIATPIKIDSATAARRVIGTLPAIGRALVGLALAGILAACQIAFAPPPVYRAGETQNDRPAIDPHAVPLVGSPDAPYIVTLLFDFKCPHCQKIHSMLEEVIRRYDGKIAFVLCPAPLNNQCNPYISRYVDEFKDSCELAKIGLAVWVADRKAFGVFDGWMFSPEPGDVWHARSLDAARAKAVELVGQAKFDAARADPWIDRFMQTSIRIFGDTIAPDQSGSAVPKLVFGSRWVTPEPHDANDLILILRESLAVPSP